MVHCTHVLFIEICTLEQAVRVAHHRSDALALAIDDLRDKRVGREQRAAHDRTVGNTAVRHAQRRIVEITAVGATKGVPGTVVCVLQT